MSEKVIILYDSHYKRVLEAALIERIGSGGGGVVYLANHLRLGKKVVLKADKRKLTTRPELLRREVDVLKNLTHSYIPQVYDFFVENDTVYTAMDYIQGESLDKPLKRGERFSQAQVIKWAIQMLEALDYLHQPIHGDPPKGYVHSDIKPANLMKRPNNDICLIDFNIALAIGENNVVGCSIGYASPEHYGLDYSEVSGTVIDENETVTLNDETATITLSKIKSSSSNSKKRIMPDVRSDIYSVGATLYHLLYQYSFPTVPKNGGSVKIRPVHQTSDLHLPKNPVRNKQRNAAGPFAVSS